MAFKFFASTPPEDVVDTVARAFGLDGLDDARFFSRYDFARLGTVEALAALAPMLEAFYLPCKAKLYLRNLGDMTVLTVLRQLLRPTGRHVVAIERNAMIDHKHTKVMYYSVRKVGAKSPTMAIVRGPHTVTWQGCASGGRPFAALASAVATT